MPLPTPIPRIMSNGRTDYKNIYQNRLVIADRTLNNESMTSRVFFTLGFVIMSFAAMAFRANGQNASKPVVAALVEAENQVDAKRGVTPWEKGIPVLPLSVGNLIRTGELSRAAVRLTDLSMLRIDEMTTIEISPPAQGGKSTLDIRQGATYFFSREKAQDLQIRTPATNGALRGTEFVVRVAANGKTTLTMIDGAVELSNPSGCLLLKSGEQGEVEVGRAPHKTAVIDAKNILQWCLYYPGVLEPRQLGLTAEEERVLAASLAAYRAGDLLGALVQHPRGRSGGLVGARLYRAGLLLAVGQVDKARAELGGIPNRHPGKLALEQMIAAVKFEEWKREGAPETAAEWMAESYYQQSRSDLDSALAAAKKATELAPDFGFGWEQVAELQFSFGRTPQALDVLEKALALSPRNAQALALQGFLLSAQNRIGKARACFDEAIALDGALGNAWLGRGLCSIRKGRDVDGRADLQMAATLEPNRSILRSYLGKAFSQTGNNKKAKSELDRAVQFDPDDPTPWLYSAIQNKQENRYNQAISDLEKSVTLNDNRRVYRSRFLLDQDLAVRSTNLAAIYLNNGMVEQSVREATLAVNNDYASASAHLFLANSFDALRDPDRVLLRYETPWFSELLLSHLLSPVGGGPLSQFVSQQEYSKLFESDGFGVNSITDYYSTGALREIGSQYGTFGNFAYAIDADYQYANGTRPNNRIERLETYGTFKFQLGPRDTILFQTKFEKLDTGNLLQYYDQKEVDRSVTAKTSHFTETQDPALLLLGYHHEWSPGNHTLLLVGQLANRQTTTAEDTTQSVITRDVSSSTSGLTYGENDFNHPFNNPQVYETLHTLVGQGQIQRINTVPLDLEYSAKFKTYTAELQQIVTLGPDTIVLGGRYQKGTYDTSVRMTNHDTTLESLFDTPAANQDFSVGMDRIDFYAYNTVHVARWLSLTGGVTYNSLTYPDNFRSAPINDRQKTLAGFLPKAGFILQPTRTTVIRGAYTEGITGTSFDESVRLEPTQIAGFSQSYRTLISEDLLGSVAGSHIKTWGLSVEQKLPTRTYFGAEYLLLRQNLDRTVGTFDFLNSNGSYPNEILPSSLGVNDAYSERAISVTLNQLVGDCWSIGVRYTNTKSILTEQSSELSAALKTASADAVSDLAKSAESRRESTLNKVSLFVLYNHPCGFFARAEANWYAQRNSGYTVDTTDSETGQPRDDFWQFNVYCGYRFHRNQCEVSCGLLNIGGTDYKLEPLTPYPDLPRDRTLIARVKFNF